MTITEQNELVVNNMALVSHVLSTRFKKGSDEWEDLYQEGCYGLVLASRSYNPDLGYTFSTYAYPMIIGTIQKYKRRTGDTMGIHIPSTLYDKRVEVYKKAEELGIDVSDTEEFDKFAEKCGLPLDVFNAGISLNSATTQDTNTEVGDLIADTADPYEQVYFNDFVDEILNVLKKGLTNTQYCIMSYIILKYAEQGIAVKQQEVADFFNISRQAVSKVYLKATKLLTHKGVLSCTSVDTK